METFRVVIKGVSLFVLLYLIFSVPSISGAYDDQTTHPALSKKTVQLFNGNHIGERIKDSEALYIVQGSVDEDVAPRWLNHFYDPNYIRGLVIGSFLWPSSKQWARDTSVQRGLVENLAAGVTRGYFSGDADYSWERSIYEFAWGNKKRGLETLGHILHLIQDATVPDHTRNDPHPDVVGMGSPYELWSRDVGTKMVNQMSTENLNPLILETLGNYFDVTAQYSNKNFFSKDTINDPLYSDPIPVEYRFIKASSGVMHEIGYADIDGIEYKLVERDLASLGDRENTTYSIQDKENTIISDYFFLLSRKAIESGAGVVKLFFDEVEKEKKTRVLYEKNRSWLSKFTENLRNKFDSLFKKKVDNNNSMASIASVWGLKPVWTDSAAVPAKDVPPPIPVFAFAPTANLVQIEPLGARSIVLPIVDNLATDTSLNAPLASSSMIATSATSQISPPPTHLADNDYQPGFGGGAGGGSGQSNSNDSGGSVQDDPSPPPPSGPPPAPDTTPPDVSLEVMECSDSIVLGSCVVATSTLHVLWSSTASDVAYYEIIGATETSTTSSTSLIATADDGETYDLSLRACDTSGNCSSDSSVSVRVVLRPVVINEIVWTGTVATSSDQWIELYNPTSEDIMLDGFVLYSPSETTLHIDLSGGLNRKSYYLIEAGDDLVIRDIAADLVASFGNGLHATGDSLVLAKEGVSGTTKIDEVAVCNNWCGKGYKLRFDVRSMERKRNNWAYGTDWNVWTTWGLVTDEQLFGTDRGWNDMGATPKAENEKKGLFLF